MNDQWKTCSAEGCTRKARTKGATYCNMHAKRQHKRHTAFLAWIDRELAETAAAC